MRSAGHVRCRVAALAALLALPGCEPPRVDPTLSTQHAASAAPLQPERALRESVAAVHADAARDEGARREAAPPAAPSATAAAPAPVERARVAGLRLERVAALDAQTIFAVGQGRLYARVDAQWSALPIEGGLVRDVVATRSGVYVLARGSGANAGHVLILRVSPRRSLELLAAPRVGPANDPRALAVVREGEYYVGGALPPLLHVTARGAEPVEGPDQPVETLRRLRENIMLALQRDGRVAVFRWSEWRVVEVESYVDTALDEMGFSYVVHGDGAVVVGRPGHEVTELAGPAEFTVRAAAVLRDGRIIAAGDGRVVGLWARDRWSVSREAGVAEPLAVLGLAGAAPLVVGRDGAVIALDLRALAVPAQGPLPTR